MSEVNLIFYNLIDHLCSCLSATEKFSFDFKKYSNVDQLFTEQKLKKIKSLYLFKIYLLSFITWLDHSILKELVEFSGSEYAQWLLKLFDSKIDSYCDQSITSFPILSPSQLMIPLDDSGYTLLAMKFRPPSRVDSMMTLQDVNEIKLTMKNKWELRSYEINSIQLAAVYTKLELLYWIIPKSLVKEIDNNLICNWESGIFMMAVLPVNFYTLEENFPKGLFGSLNFIWQDNTEVGMYV